MTKTNTTYKVSTVKPSEASQPFDPKAQKSGGPKDVFENASPDAYKGLVKGNFKAEPIDGGVLGEMAEASVEPRRVSQSRYDQMQDLIGSLMCDEGGSASPADTVGNIPYVPNLHDDILKGTNLIQNMKPVVERYAALEQVLIAMYDNLRAALSPRNAWSMSVSEINSLKRYKAKLEETLADCRFQLKQAHELLNDQINAGRVDLPEIFVIPDLLED